MTTYQAILFTPDGDGWVTDFHGCKTKDEVWDKINDMGCRWYFYPIAFVITEKCRRIVGAEWMFSDCIGYSIKTVSNVLKRMYDTDPTYWTD